MDEVLVDRALEGLVLLRQLLAGKHLRSPELALVMVIVVTVPERAQAVLADEGKQARWEVVNG